MRKILYLFVLISLIYTSYSFASQIRKITLSDLQEKADLIVLAKVIDVVQDKNHDNVTIKIDSFLKGKSETKKVSFTLVTRGGLKDFDPTIKKGDTGVFFLKKSGTNVEKAYWGGIATFKKNHFDL